MRRAEELLATEFAGARSALGSAATTPMPRIVPPLDPPEASYFIRAFEAGLFGLNGTGDLWSELLFAAGTGQGFVGKVPLFLTDGVVRRVARALISRFSVAARLVYDRGWLSRQLLIEPYEPNVETGAGVDIALTTLGGELLAAIALRRTAPEIAKLQRDFAQCCRRGEHSVDNCGFPQNHAVFEYCRRYRPRYQWAIGVDEQSCFELSYSSEGVVTFHQLPSLPARSVMEMRVLKH